MSLFFFNRSWIITPPLLRDICVGVALMSVCFFAVREVFRPLHRRTPPKGKHWSLPPGPAGIPVMGNLRQFQNARRDEVALMTYVGYFHHPETDLFPIL